MKRVTTVLIGIAMFAAGAVVWAEGRREAPPQGPPYDVATVKRILSSEALYQRGYLQHEVDKNRDGISDETGMPVYAGALRDFRDANGDGLDDSTGGQLPLGLRNRLIDHNGDGIVDGTNENVGQYLNRVQTEAREMRQETDGDRLKTMLQSRDRERVEDQKMDRTRDQTRTQTATSTRSATGGAPGGGGKKAR